MPKLSSGISDKKRVKHTLMNDFCLLMISFFSEDRYRFLMLHLVRKNMTPYYHKYKMINNR